MNGYRIALGCIILHKLFK